MAPWKLFSSLQVVTLLVVSGAHHHAVSQEPKTALSPGEIIYNNRCAGCHDRPYATRAPSKAALNTMTVAAISDALTEGIMKVQGSGLTETERADLIRYLTLGRKELAPPKDTWSDGMMCPADRRAVDLSSAAPVTDFGFDKRNTRSLTARQAGLTKADLSNMELAWAIAIPGGMTMRTQPAIVGNTVFLPVADARSVYAFDVSQPLKPCVKWIYKTKSKSALRTSASYGALADGRGVIAFSGSDTTAYLVDAKTGKEIWTRHIGTYPYSLATGTPVVLKDRIIVPISQYEILVAEPNERSCCTNHGYVVSLDPKDGSQQWRYDTMEEAKPIRDRGDGKYLYGPSGAPIWSSPAVDEEKGVIFFGTGESNSPPVSKNTDAIIAVGLADGKERWSYQGTNNDIYLYGCGPHPKPDQLNCVKDAVYRDVDFGASMILASLKGGKEAMFGGQKSGTVWALDPSTGRLLWHNDLGRGSPLGGIHWGIAFADNTVYAPISAVNDAYLDSLLPNQPPPSPFKSGLYALDAYSGKVRWNFATEPDCEGDRKIRVPNCAKDIGMSAAPAVIDGAVVEGALDGYLYVLDGGNGKLLWKFDTSITYQGINGVAGRGGAIDSASISAANGLLFVNSGYNMFGQTSGNVFLAFKPKAGRKASNSSDH
ncbi:PQQ-binding-like beta-propeller repeat protein [Granulicella sp. dw_53]|uniref:outer membrane protein assembly factor BamB family protein n=1 Tax=Granulicella sp. dw_53 TaxID=2719792 RepID=UPI001BD2C122|nr:PQQ-binding-like beta-propeller repeat protein [Granulicella sp. dw_53]